MIKNMAREHIHGTMDLNTHEIGKMANEMEMALLHPLMDEFILEIGWRIKSMVRA